MTRRLSVALLCILAAACQREDPPGAYEPRGRYYERLDASGRRHIVLGSDDEPLAKLRIKDDSVKVYDAEMISVGTVEWDGDVLSVSPRGKDPIEMTRPAAAVRELPGRFRLEMVENGWAVFGPQSRRLGYVARFDDGATRFSWRDDYSAAPRAYARAGEAGVKSPAGEAVVKTRPDLVEAPLVLAFAADGEFPVLDRVAIGAWLLHHYEASVPQDQAVLPAVRP